LSALEDQLNKEKETLRLIKYFKDQLLSLYGMDTLREWIDVHGLTYEQYMKSNMWRITSYLKKVLIGRCERCGLKTGLCAHHLTYEHLGFEIFNLEDLQILCEDCHRKAHNIYGGQDYYLAGDVLKHTFPAFFDATLRKKLTRAMK
jgi:hypothetical protein